MKTLHDPKHLFHTGSSIADAERIILMIHGRGASAESILTLAQEFNVVDAAFIAPQAANHTWYPYSFMRPTKENQPWLDSALSSLKTITDDLLSQGKRHEQIVLLGFSQGACLATEFAARNAARWGGVIGFSGGLIGDQINPGTYSGDFAGTPVFLGCSDNDFHIPESRVHETAKQLESRGASVETVIYPDMGHTIVMDEILKAQKIIDRAG
ncbi:phospholipase/carboxylesterase [Cyclonatronum proteinivorum]|uniref:Phospholipase/carboxylesterase n=1 Tax=Cyclonatronum proteinivorum TaxID=1457365 RepID=A0A345UIU9_9BACT|nr:dienelactone hydrolase family protein [Cyclonatronum proteinivorum]AXJ00401.1 phospholipase/carboxylesterase [Cyclonatronum proteinivorum]